MTTPHEPSTTNDTQSPSQHPQPSALRELLQTREVRKILSLLIPEFLDLWAGDHPLKKKAARPIGRSFQKSLRHPRANGGDRDDGLGDVMPEIVDRLLASLQAAAETAETLSPEEKQKHLKALGAYFTAGQSGRLLTSLLRSLHALHETHPTALADALTPAIRSWIVHTDFGALRDVADRMGPEIKALAEAINAILWQYPSKLVLSLSFLPDPLNLAVICLQKAIRRFNQASPDLVADIALSLVRSVDGRAVGAALNELTEVIRKIHTGSALIGDPGMPRFQNDMRQMLDDIVAGMDSPTYWSAKVALEEDKAIMARSLFETLADRPDFITEGLRTYAARKNPGFRSGRYGLEALIDMTDTDLGTALEDGVSDLDLQELGDIVNLVCELSNRVLALRPELARNLAEQLAASLDVAEIKDAAGGILETSGAAFRPVLRATLPDILSQLCRIMEPADDGYEDQMAEARQHLRSLLIGE